MRSIVKICRFSLFKNCQMKGMGFRIESSGFEGRVQDLGSGCRV